MGGVYTVMLFLLYFFLLFSSHPPAYSFPVLGLVMSVLVVTVIMVTMIIMIMMIMMIIMLVMIIMVTMMTQAPRAITHCAATHCCGLVHSRDCPKAQRECGGSRAGDSG